MMAIAEKPACPRGMVLRATVSPVFAASASHCPVFAGAFVVAARAFGLVAEALVAVCAPRPDASSH